MDENWSVSEVQRGQIVVLHKKGYTKRQIGEKLGARTCADAKRNGCPRKITPKTGVLMKRNFPTCSAKKIRADLNETDILVSRQIVSIRWIKNLV